MRWLPTLFVVGSLSSTVVGRVFASRLSALHFTDDIVAVRNFPWRTRRFHLSEINRFDEVAGEGVRSRARYVSAVLLLTDGSRLIVRAAGDTELGAGVTGLNNRLAEMRRRDDR